MPKDEKLNQHIYLFDMMAEKLDQNLEVAVIEGKITPDQVVEAAFRCSDCEKSELCAAVLPRENDLQNPFENCRNRALFNDLKAEIT